MQIIRQETKRVFKYLSFIVADSIVIYMSFMISYYLRFYTDIFSPDPTIPSFYIYGNTALFLTFIWLVMFFIMGLFDNMEQSVFDSFIHITKGVTICTVIMISMNFLYREYMFSRIVIFLWWGISIALLLGVHQILRLLKKFYVKKYNLIPKILIMGSGKVARHIKSISRYRYLAKYYFYPFKKEDFDSDKFIKYITKRKIDELIVTDRTIPDDLTKKIVIICENIGVIFKFVPDMLDVKMGEITVDSRLDIPVLQIKPFSFLENNIIKKRIFDVLFSIIGLSVLIIPLIFIAILVKITSRGSLFYKHKRVGHGGDEFAFLKFRTMIVNADKILDSMRHLSQRSGPVFKMERDPRVTFLGKFLRKYSIDEIPQFFNVLRGDMGIVGPRPQIVWEAERCDEYGRRRLKVLPGITGLWQISGRSKLSYEKMIELDIYYLEHWSLILDVKIILNTIPAVLLGDGAY